MLAITRAKVKVDAAFVLPSDFGSGLRKQDDIVWGFWAPTQQEQQVWLQLQNALKTHDQKIDIVYDDTDHPATGKYTQIIYPSSNLNSNWMLFGLLAVVVVLVSSVLLVARKRRKINRVSSFLQ